MRCPKCDEKMEEVRKDGVYIDVCRRCRGVFLDAGELEELLHDSYEEERHYHKKKEKYDYDYEYEKDYNHQHGSHKHKKKHKMKSILGDLFDF